MNSSFKTIFHSLTTTHPFPWQEALYKKFCRGEIPETLDLPTGLGKTSVVAIWLSALVTNPDKMPRRLVYVVNRRTVVDQTTAEAERLCDALKDKPALAEFRKALASMCALPLPKPDAPPLAISTLRGQFADNGEWCADPSRPAVIVGTVDMIGSGLLFSRYTRGFKTRPLYAGFLGQDVLLVHDEAHLEPAFQKLLESIVAAQNSAADPRKLRVIQLTATSRSATVNSKPPFTLTSADHENQTVQGRLNAIKRLSLVALGEKEKLDIKLATLAKAKTGERTVLVFTRTVGTALKIAAELGKGEGKGRVATLTGTMRGKERDELVSKNPVFQRFFRQKDRAPGVEPARGGVFLVATSAGEVGVNISADDLVCDLSTYESMTQRFGRVNRFGERKENDASEITVVHETRFDTDKPLDVAREKTLALLKEARSASPADLDRLPAAERIAAFSPPPELRVATEVQFDAWALTSIREPIAARPPVEPYLHGEAEWLPPETHIAWRDQRDFRYVENPQAFLDEFPLKPAELLRDTTSRIAAILAELLEDRTGLPDAWVVANNGSVTRFPLSDFDKDAAETLLAEATLILPSSAGGLDGNGILSADADTVVDDASGIIRHEDATCDKLPDGPAKLVRFIEISDEDAEDPRFLFWCEPIVENTPGGTRAARRAQPERLDAHTNAVAANAAAIAAKCFPDKSTLPSGEPDLRRCVILAARLHDRGKNRGPWQRNLGNLAYDSSKPETILAKAAPGMRGRNVAEQYRHEFGSLNDADGEAEFADLDDAERDIVLHIVAAHHGRARPHFPADEIFDYASVGSPEKLAALATDVPRRFARLQERYGRWGLAWLESILRAADYAASGGIVSVGGAGARATEPRVHNIGIRTSGNRIEQQIAPTATLAVNPANPGHYFACCGLFELAARITGNGNPAEPALAWFDQDSATHKWRFHLANTPPLNALLANITDAEIIALQSQDRAKSALEIRLLKGKVQLHVDWWRHEGRSIGKLKPWAGNTSVRDITDDMRRTLRTKLATTSDDPTEHILFSTSTANEGEPFYFDANRAVNARAQDVGFSVDKLKKGGVNIATNAAPAVELLTLIGLQRARPSLTMNERGKEREYDYYFWQEPIPITLLAATVNGLLAGTTMGLRFSNPSRAKDYRGFAPGKVLHNLNSTT